MKESKEYTKLKEKLAKLPYDNLVIEPRDKSFLGKIKVVDFIQVKEKDFKNNSEAHYCKWVKNGAVESLERKTISIKEIGDWEVISKFKSYSEYDKTVSGAKLENKERINLYNFWNKIRNKKEKQ